MGNGLVEGRETLVLLQEFLYILTFLQGGKKIAISGIWRETGVVQNGN